MRRKCKYYKSKNMLSIVYFWNQCICNKFYWWKKFPKTNTESSKQWQQIPKAYKIDSFEFRQNNITLKFIIRRGLIYHCRWLMWYLNDVMNSFSFLNQLLFYILKHQLNASYMIPLDNHFVLSRTPTITR